MAPRDRCGASVPEELPENRIARLNARQMILEMQLRQAQEQYRRLQMKLRQLQIQLRRQEERHRRLQEIRHLRIIAMKM